KNSRVSEEKINLIDFYLNSFHVNVEEDESKGGVVLASPLAGAYVDRPIVFYLGMDAGWTRRIAEKPWVDSERVRRANIEDFQLLLQNGRRQYYMVQNRHLNRNVTPCFYFNLLAEEEISSFEDLSHRRYCWPGEIEAEGFSPPSSPATFKRVKTISQSALKYLVRCPREYYFSRLVPTVENRHLLKGSLYHDFAEFYLQHPDFVRERGREVFVEIIVEELSKVVDDLEKYSLKVESRVALSNIMAYLDSRDINCPEASGARRRDEENIFSKIFGLPLSSQVSEVWFDDTALGVKGKIDLLQAPGHLLDYKSGRKKSVSKIIRSSNLDLAEDEVDFQAILYLVYQRRVNPDKKIKFTFFHFLENLADVIAGESSLEDTLVTVTYYPRFFADQVSEKETYDWLLEGVKASNDRYKTLEGLGYEAYRDFFTSVELPEFYDKQLLKKSKLSARFIEYTAEIFKDCAYVEKGCRSVLKKLVDFRKSNYFSEDLDRFEKFLEEQLDDLNHYMGTTFPLQGWLKDFDIDDSERRDLIRDDNHGT
ncbi:MAG: PD-(D/E)XK nuclease family protein, partial [bacterium]